MTPLEFLRDEIENVERALKETLRYDYGFERSSDYFEECASRIVEIKKTFASISSSDIQMIAAQLNELGFLASWIALIERSHLGEFSWPFAYAIRAVASKLLSEKNLKGDPLDPIIHVVAEGRGYRIVNEGLPATSSRRRLAVVAFPRSLKHHVLLHAIFGHELGHTALFTAGPGAILKKEVVPALVSRSPLRDPTAVTAWLNDPNAPVEVKRELAHYQHLSGSAFSFKDQFRQSWLVEIVCDLFGLLLFGPAFVAAHRTILEPLRASPFHLGLGQPSHPPYAVRRKILMRAFRLVGWTAPIIGKSAPGYCDAEQEFLRYLEYDPFPTWADLVDDSELSLAISGIRKVFAAHAASSYTHLPEDTLLALIRRLDTVLPPIVENLSVDGVPSLHGVTVSQTLHAGWMYWLGKDHLPGAIKLSFFDVNRLCDLALLQQRAMDDVISARSTP